MLMIVSPSVMRLFRLVSHTLRHSLRSGAAGCLCGAAAGAIPPTQRHSASPVAPPGHGCALKSPTCVQFQYKPRADVGGHSSPRSTFSPCPLIPIASPVINTMIKCYADSQVNKKSFKLALIIMFLGLYRLPVFILYLYGNKPIKLINLNFTKTNVELSKISETAIGYWFEVTSPNQQPMN